MNVSTGTLLGQLFVFLLLIGFFSGLLYIAYQIPASLKRIAPLERLAGDDERQTRHGGSGKHID